MSLRPPAQAAARQGILADHNFEHILEFPLEEAQGSENSPTTNQQGPLEEIHDLHCPVNRQLLTLSLQAEFETNSLHPDVWMCIPLMSCFQPPELA